MVRSIKDLTIAKQLYEGLYRFDLENQLQPALACDLLQSDDGLGYTFTLRKAQWSNGEFITAYDFVRSLKEVLDPTFPSDYASMLFPIKMQSLLKWVIAL